MINRECFLCSKTKHNGIILNGEKICKTCEEEIVNLTNNNPKYDYYREKIKTILFK
ncbi:sigma factor G inhibitor Gin [Clostridium uliginosum]|uniref:Inhibitor of sigma-G Gin n=1 Tax=Clostridium uliginosum TaxID=119641 RepID=A0A1I1MF00_9CLOT|nr:sigma factor G inhibitor Gin [Clostridium uliginosum]SFC80170.1 Inhibitor of sigma-G Gin [Clostridium uliginosum]